MYDYRRYEGDIVWVGGRLLKDSKYPLKWKLSVKCESIIKENKREKLKKKDKCMNVER